MRSSFRGRHISAADVAEIADIAGIVLATAVLQFPGAPALTIRAGATQPHNALLKQHSFLIRRSFKGAGIKLIRT